MATAAQDHPTAGRGPGTPRRRRSLFRHRRGGSRAVTLLKILLPLTAMSLIAVVILWAQLPKGEIGFRVGFSSVQPEDARNLRMVKARYAGRSESKQPYLLTAESALQDHPGADLIHLTEPKGDITMKSGAWVALNAPAGQYFQDNQELDLWGGVSLFHDSGLEFNSPTAHIDLEASTAKGDDPVVGKGPSADITSEGFRILDEGDRVIFTGKAHLTLYRNSDKQASPPERTN